MSDCNIIKDIKEVQAYLFSLLETFADFCDENHITYFLAYGTCLGAVRHNEFIPWDDDVDVFVPREDYEKIHKFAKDGILLRNRYKFEFWDTEKQYLYPFCKLVDTSTILTEQISNPWPMGIFLDIFPLDAVPASKISKDKNILKLDVNLMILNCTIWKPKGNESIFKKILFSIMTFLPKTFSTHFRVRCPKLIDKYAKSWQVGTSNCYLSRIVWGEGIIKQVYEYSDFFPPVELILNNRLFKVPCNYDKLLTMWYGNYMQLPPENERIPHFSDVYVMKEHNPVTEFSSNRSETI